MRGVRVLVVEDEVTLAQAIARGLQAEGFTVDVEHDGESGLWRAQEQRYGAVVLDVLLPKMNGYRVCAAMRREQNWTPVLMLTAKDGEYDEAEALDNGADDFLSKPFSFVVLVARLRALARRGSTPRPPILRVGALELDPATRECHRDDREIELTARQFSVLEVLMREAPNVVLKADILDEIWGTDVDRDPNVVEVYVSALRRKVDQPFGTRTIQTVPRLGYRMVSDG
jgi:two-component system, OmpR family, response regulator